MKHLFNRRLVVIAACLLTWLDDCNLLFVSQVVMLLRILVCWHVLVSVRARTVVWLTLSMTSIGGLLGLISWTLLQARVVVVFDDNSLFVIMLVVATGSLYWLWLLTFIVQLRGIAHTIVVVFVSEFHLDVQWLGSQVLTPRLSYVIRKAFGWNVVQLLVVN